MSMLICLNLILSFVCIFYDAFLNYLLFPSRQIMASQAKDPSADDDAVV
jgi:hypothetical protein